jgi:hypothetical protein
MEMNDFENEIFTDFARDIRLKHPDAKVVGEYVRTPSTFPTVTLSEYENVMVDALMDSSQEETYSGLGYRLQVFSNKIGGKKTEAKAIFVEADKKLRGMGFQRRTYTTTPEIYDSTIFSITATYEAIVAVNGVVYKR